jgi:hypothetical protein
MFEWIDDTFDLENTKHYNLSIQVSLGGFSFSIVDPQKNQLVVLKHIPLKISSEVFIARRLTECIETEKLLQNTFQKTKIIVFTEKFTLIPEHLFVAEEKKNMLHSLFEISDENRIEENSLEKFKTKLLFSLPDKLETVFGENNPGFSFVHPLSVIAGQLPPIKKEYGLVALFEHAFLYTFFYKNAEILHANRFSIKHMNDAVFFLITIFNQLKINRNETELFVAGSLNIPDEPEKITGSYFREISLLDQPGIIIKPEFKNKRPYKLFPLLLYS